MVLRQRGLSFKRGDRGRRSGKICPNVLPLLVPGALSAAHHRLPCRGGFACPKNEPPRITTRRRCLQGQLPAKRKGNGNKKRGGGGKKIEQGAERHFGYPLFPPSLQREAKRARHARGNEIKKVETTKADEKRGKEEEEERLAEVPKDPRG